MRREAKQTVFASTKKRNFAVHLAAGFLHTHTVKIFFIPHRNMSILQKKRSQDLHLQANPISLGQSVQRHQHSKSHLNF